MKLVFNDIYFIDKFEYVVDNGIIKAYITTQRVKRELSRMRVMNDQISLHYCPFSEPMDVVEYIDENKP